MVGERCIAARHQQARRRGADTAAVEQHELRWGDAQHFGDDRARVAAMAIVQRLVGQRQHADQAVERARPPGARRVVQAGDDDAEIGCQPVGGRRGADKHAAEPAGNDDLGRRSVAQQVDQRLHQPRVGRGRVADAKAGKVDLEQDAAGARKPLPQAGRSKHLTKRRSKVLVVALAQRDDRRHAA